MGTPIWAIEGVALDSTGDLVTNSLGDVVRNLGGGGDYAEKVLSYGPITQPEITALAVV